MRITGYRQKILICCFFIITVLIGAEGYIFSSSLPAASQDGVTTVSDYTINCACGPSNGQQNVWINLDIEFPESGYSDSTYSDAGSNEEVYNTFFDDFDYSPSTSSLFYVTAVSATNASGASYFINVYNETPVHFSTQYYDAFGNDPSSGYPQVSYWSSNTQSLSAPVLLKTVIFKAKTPSLNVATLAMSSSTTHWQYSLDTTIPCGNYQYQYIVKNDMASDQYVLSAGSFTVCMRPCNVCNCGLPASSFTSTSKVHLQWNAVNSDAGGTTFKLYVGKNPNNLVLVYTGPNNYYDLASLDYSSKYYWQVEADNIYGVSAFSSVYDFSTINQVAKAYNYPNPFNPSTNQTTNIVFDMQDAGFAEITIYTEFGHKVWRQTFFNLNKGANQIQYDGRDDNGRELYNGTYICQIRRKFGYMENSDHCRLLIIK